MLIGKIVISIHLYKEFKTEFGEIDWNNWE